MIVTVRAGGCDGTAFSGGAFDFAGGGACGGGLVGCGGGASCGGAALLAQALHLAKYSSPCCSRSASVWPRMSMRVGPW